MARRGRRGANQAALTAAACRGDVYAFLKLVLPHQGALFNLAYRLLGDREAAGEVVNEAMVLAYKDVCRAPQGTLKSRLLELVIRRCYARLSPRRRHTWGGHPDGGGSRPEECQPADALEQTILSLPPEQRAIVVLSDVEGLSYQEIADALHVPRSRVEAQLSQARARLRDMLRVAGC